MLPGISTGGTGGGGAGGSCGGAEETMGVSGCDGGNPISGCWSPGAGLGSSEM